MGLLFNAEATVDSGDGPLNVPEHGMRVVGHIALVVRDCGIDQWKKHFTVHSINIEKEICWGTGWSL